MINYIVHSKYVKGDKCRYYINIHAYFGLVSFGYNVFCEYENNHSGQSLPVTTLPVANVSYTSKNRCYIKCRCGKLGNEKYI